MTNEKETHAIESWQSLIGIVKALGEYEKAINITQSEWCSIEHGARKRFDVLYEGYVSNVVKSIGKVLVEVCNFCHLEGICFNDIVKNSRMIDTKTIDRNLMAWSVRLLVYECKSDICTILTHVFCILELKAIMLGSGIEVVESTGSIGVVTYSPPSSTVTKQEWSLDGNVQIKVFVKSISPDVDKENDARIVMCRRIEELMGEAEEWCEKEDAAPPRPKGRGFRRENTMNLYEFQKEHQRWANKNFGPHEAWQPLLGIIKELGEYEEAKVKGDIPEVLDAIGDVMIFMADYCSCEGFLFETIVANARTRILDSNLLIWGGKLCHHHLKKEQNIRGEQSALRADIKVVLTYIVGILDIQARLLGTSVLDVTLQTWEQVKLREW